LEAKSKNLLSPLFDEKRGQSREVGWTRMSDVKQEEDGRHGVGGEGESEKQCRAVNDWQG
jgi:hypothetical protein